MYVVTVVDTNETYGDEVMFKMTVDADKVSEALEAALQARVYGPTDYQKVEVDQ